MWLLKYYVEVADGSIVDVNADDTFAARLLYTEKGESGLLLFKRGKSGAELAGTIGWFMDRDATGQTVLVANLTGMAKVHMEGKSKFVHAHYDTGKTRP